MMHSNESAENYLETILILSQKLPVVRSVDIANELGYKKSSISIAMKNLREKNLITVTSAGFIYLTEEGQQIAEMIYERHQLLSECLMKLGVNPQTAAADACRIEHVLIPETFEKIKEHYLKQPGIKDSAEYQKLQTIQNFVQTVPGRQDRDTLPGGRAKDLTPT